MADTSGTVGRWPEPFRLVGRAACEPVEDTPASVADIEDELAACVTPNPADLRHDGQHSKLQVLQVMQ